MALPTRKKYQYRVIKKILSPTDNPHTWESELNSITYNENLIGYLFNIKSGNFGTYYCNVTLYTIPANEHTTSISGTELSNAFSKWLQAASEDISHIAFTNPPLELWLNTKAEWIKKQTTKIAKQYCQPYDDCLSTIYIELIRLYNKNVYMGSLNYIATCIKHAVVGELRANRNKLTLSNDKVLSFDEVLGENDDGSVLTLYDLLSTEDIIEYNHNAEELLDIVTKDLSMTFSQREIDQITKFSTEIEYINYPLYRKYVKWRQTHKRGDYVL